MSGPNMCAFAVNGHKKRFYTSKPYYTANLALIKGIDRPFGEGVKRRLIGSLLINWRLGNFFFLLLTGFHYKISKKPTDPGDQHYIPYKLLLLS